MSTLVFYEKPGCAGNAQQKAQLRAAGHTLEVRDLLAERWTPQRLRPFFGSLPVSEWFNRSAPSVKRGEIDPGACDSATALALMCEQPLLIRRPLLQAAEWRCAGFEPALVGWLLGPAAAQASEACPRSAEPCPSE